jgi:energy-coupling factor transport system substrate-specific component
MDPRWVRIVAAAIAFLVVAFVGVVVLGDFSAEAAANSWALVAAVGLVVAFVAYAAVEYLQTGGVASIARQFDTRTIVLMPLAIALNIILGQAVASALKIPIYLDSIGTILVGALAGPIPGALTGFLANVLWTYVVPVPFNSSVAAAFAIVAAVIGLLAGLFGRIGWLRPRPDRTFAQLGLGAVVTIALILGLGYLAFVGYTAIIGPAGLEVASDEVIFVVLGYLALALVVATIIGLLLLLFVRRDLTAAYVVVGGVITGIIAALISAPISANLFSGVTGSGTDFLVAAFRQAGVEIGAATLGQGLISDPIDKVTTFFVVYLILTAMARRTKARFPQGERLVEGADEDWQGAPA